MFFERKLGVNSRKHKYFNVFTNWTLTIYLFATKTCNRDIYVRQQIVWHLLIDVSRFTVFLLDFGWIVPVTLCGTYYHKSPLVDGGVEVSSVDDAMFIYTKKNNYF